MDKIIDTSYFKNNFYNSLNKSSLTPPPKVFSIVWTILYILMGISSYIVSEKNGNLDIYVVQLIVNLLWSFLFFTFKWYLLSFLWILLLIVLVVIMIKDFYKSSKISAYLQIPYLLWIIWSRMVNILLPARHYLLKIPTACQMERRE